ncbi:MAG: lysine/arginine/ornithine ABC transporter substrate-binding protein [Comamonas sp.]
MRASLTAVAVATLATLAGSALAADLRVGTNPAYEPFEYKTPSGEIVGFDIDIANALCEQLKRKCVFVESEFDSVIPGLQAKKFDVIISSISITPERQRVVDFTKRYYKTPSAIVVKKTVKYDNPASLKGMKIGVLKGSTQEKWALGELKPAGVNVVAYQSQDQVYLDLQAGRLDGTVADKVEVNGGFLRKPEGKDYGYVGRDQYDEKYYGEGIGIAMRKGQKELKQQLDEAIDTIRKNGTYAKIAKKYFDFDPYGQ